MNILEAQRELYSQLRKNDNVVGIGNDGSVITVLVSGEIVDIIPTEYKGYEVKTCETGRIYFQEEI